MLIAGRAFLDSPTRYIVVLNAAVGRIIFAIPMRAPQLLRNVLLSWLVMVSDADTAGEAPRMVLNCI